MNCWFIISIYCFYRPVLDQGSYRVGKIMKKWMTNFQLWKSRKPGFEFGKVEKKAKLENWKEIAKNVSTTMYTFSKMSNGYFELTNITCYWINRSVTVSYHSLQSNSFWQGKELAYKFHYCLRMRTSVWSHFLPWTSAVGKRTLGTCS